MIIPKKPNHLTGISLSEIFQLDYRIDGRTKYAITSDMFGRYYYLYSVDSKGKCTKTNHKAQNPTELYKYCV